MATVRAFESRSVHRSNDGSRAASMAWLTQIKALPAFILSSPPMAIIKRRTNVPSYDIMVIAAVLISFGFFSGTLAFATFDESRRHSDKAPRGEASGARAH
ncbi:MULTISPECIES: hypothetical protein [unclassified Mesorhizobium]|uniref:hypothetical protein n=1 Tax=unclassified Mesorhizobium TaxID=325217 RepID=UPI000FD7A2AB|nr:MULTISPECIES: hypothetical protein [unclassified Mesorhizobium]TGU41593.1 hypothetical protein EN799_03295 [bacterium M00.F.Ca.ET.156.01.1.1]TGV89783.1 hypothetical protein EN792_006390 [Mesorhizobium sp. M00.F.Ca.ET.149.01.1.1]RWC91802.1 MAG: hypothetical protein EOS72_03895 [Mesorhizobium sp.]TGQ95230.1 hypothetical protein EN851_06800 [Mesorhizobium sp. M8A.F.Ca.ET.208.01.1.1]TGR34687.1 hypothetical protein EN845_01520 [Mesorhizobium sp. M8A.F.Ca.ET.202.01.1.1]